MGFLEQIAVLVGLAAANPAPTCATSSPVVEQVIAQKKRELKAEEYCQYRSYAKADIDGDGVNDLLVLFGVEPRESATNSIHFLAVFPSSLAEKPLLVEVGRRGKRLAESLAVVEKKIV